MKWGSLKIHLLCPEKVVEHRIKDEIAILNTRREEWKWLLELCHGFPGGGGVHCSVQCDFICV